VGSGGSSALTGNPNGGASSAILGGTPDAGADVSLKPDAGRTGGTTLDGTSSGGVGGGNRTGGMTGSGGRSTTGSATNAGDGGATGGVTNTGSDTEGCDVGVYDAASPPKVLTLTGNLGVHDPAAIAADGTTYLYATGLGAKTSSNLTAWNAAARPLTTPTWMGTTITGVGDLWAPDVSLFGGKYHLYYAGSTFGSNKSCIGHATRASLSSGSWADSGAATLCSNVGSNDNWNAIDPNVVLDAAGTPWLALGSFWGGLKIVQLDSDGNRVGTTVTGIAARPSNGGALEAPFIVRRCGYFYLFMSWDKCCDGAKSTYNIRVARATSVTGPYSDKAGTAAMQGGGTLVAQGDDTWAGPGGQSVMIAGQKAYLVYHAYAKSNGTATLRIAELVWDASGWPVPVGP
jgi:arabinan endo-1,5-alpha-L-arabinosidase